MIQFMQQNVYLLIKLMRKQERYTSSERFSRSNYDLDLLNPISPSNNNHYYSNIRYANSHRAQNKRYLNTTNINIQKPITEVTSMTSQYKSKRKKIFESFPVQIQHFQIGIRMDNLQFQELDQTYLPSWLENSSCSCKSSVESCKHIVSQIPGEKLKEMKHKYENIKEYSAFTMSYLEVKKLLVLLPDDYPEILIPVTQNLIRVIQVKQKNMRLLGCIVYHAKMQYLSYWIYSEMIKLSDNIEFLIGQVQELINSHSKDLKNIIRKSSLNIGQLCDRFCLSGLSILPVYAYGNYIEKLNQEGKNYPARILFVYLLYHKNDLEADTIDSVLNHSKVASTPWSKIILAATNSKLK